MNESINGCLEALLLCYKQRNVDDRTPAIERLKVLYDSIIPPQERSPISINEYESSLIWEKKLIGVFQESSLPTEQLWAYICQVEDPIIYGHLVLYLIEKLVSEQKIQESYTYIEHLPVLQFFKKEDTKYKGYRVLLKYYAELPDVNMFMELLKKSQTIKQKHEIESCKWTLVERTSEISGWEASIQLCQHKKIGDKYIRAALTPITETWAYSKVYQLFEKHPELDSDKTHTRLQILMKTYSQNAKSDPSIEALEFEKLFEEVKQIDPALKWGDFRLRDGLLMDLGLSSHNKAKITLCRKTIKNNALKKELNFWLEQLI
ncbi:hypothetical protein [Paenibacillus agricola]|uniref:Uncharacterized protein n=1 Tax=Paenibacillus agricola TaxID=2716264 RepID=A0ABX0JAT5_9BACL|nr:hypothetical protein [Paenibacillus agricola]NHN30855.1 hypothetical protein [Paenibacillus agricola]